MVHARVDLRVEACELWLNAREWVEEAFNVVVDDALLALQPSKDNLNVSDTRLDLGEEWETDQVLDQEVRAHQDQEGYDVESQYHQYNASFFNI